MTDNRAVAVHADRAALIVAVARRIETTLVDVLAAKQAAHIVLTGGTVGIDVLSELDATGSNPPIDWSRVHVWWGDERWLPSGDAERNDHQADKALLNRVALLPENIHRFAADDGHISLDDAAASYAKELAEHAPAVEVTPAFDILLLGVGPDGHIASLFPDREGISELALPVVAVRESPKPPPERLSLTLPALCRAERVWLALSGSDKASALSLALSGANTVQVPVAGVFGTRETIFFVDADAAADVPAELIAREG